jgi:hypothetical protein
MKVSRFVRCSLKYDSYSSRSIFQFSQSFLFFLFFLCDFTDVEFSHPPPSSTSLAAIAKMGIFNRREEENSSISAAADQRISEKDMEQQRESDTIQDESSLPRTFDQALEKRVVRKIDLHLIPLVMVLCMLYIVIGTITG